MDSLRGDHIRRGILLFRKAPSRQRIVVVAFAIVGLFLLPE